MDMPPSSYAPSPGILSRIEALEPLAVASLLAFKRSGADRWSSNNDDVPSATSTAAPAVSSDANDDEDEEWLPSPPPKKRIRRKYVQPKVQPEDASGTAAAVVTDASDEEAGDAPPTTLYAPGDEAHINPTHNILRRDILELFVEAPRRGAGNGTARRPAGNASNASRFAGRIGLRCKFCKHLSDRAPMSIVYPETLTGIYRACTVRFQKRHLPHCAHVPQEVWDALEEAKDAKARGSKSHWEDSAVSKGLRNAKDGKGIVFCPEIEG